MHQTIHNSQVELIMIIMPITIFYIGYVKLRQLSSDIAWTETPYSVLWAPGYFHLAVMLNTLGTANGGRCSNCFGEEQDQYPGTLQYIPRNMHTVLLCFALLWLYNRS